MLTLTAEQLEDVNAVLDRFETDRIERVMKFLDWAWAGAADRVPMQYEIRTAARRHVMQAARMSVKEGGRCVSGSGGLHACCESVEVGGVKRMSVELSFRLETSENVEVFDEPDPLA